MEYSVKTLSQLQPVLRGFRKAAGLTQAAIAARLGITQQSYAKFEAHPAAAGVERLFTVLRLLNASLTLSQDEPALTTAAPVAKIAPASPRKRGTQRAPAPATRRTVPAVKKARRTSASTAAASAKVATRKAASEQDARATSKPKRAVNPSKKRESW
ncbi:helix-turn-helix transcriptional regulator [Paraburkholderia bengalensis]|uniref:Helix-turn-helix transcriptional regulator n=1 Tax=Paraburkholderia bengalensis TaxID=2747562 RepID=A0ABU8J0M4_9BURK